MTDVIDQGCQREEEDRARALKAQAEKQHMEPVGFCYNCDEVVFEGCFCDIYCRDDYEQRERKEKIRGGYVAN